MTSMVIDKYMTTWTIGVNFPMQIYPFICSDMNLCLYCFTFFLRKNILVFFLINKYYILLPAVEVVIIHRVGTLIPVDSVIINLKS